VLFVEAIRVDEDHLQEAVRKVLPSRTEKNFQCQSKSFALGAASSAKPVHALGKIRAAQKVFVAGGKIQDPCLVLVLNVGSTSDILADFLVEVIP